MRSCFVGIKHQPKSGAPETVLQEVQKQKEAANFRPLTEGDRCQLGIFVLGSDTYGFTQRCRMGSLSWSSGGLAIEKRSALQQQ